MSAKDDANFDKMLDDLARVSVSKTSGTFITTAAHANPMMGQPRPRPVFASKTQTAEMYGILYVQKDL